MLLPRPSRLNLQVTPQANYNLVNPEFCLDTRYAETILPSEDSRTLSWLPQSPSGSLAPETLTLKKSKSYARPQNTERSLAKVETHSSLHSLCNPDCGTSSTSIYQHSLFVGQPPPPQISNPLYLFPLPPSQTTRNPLPWRSAHSTQNPRSRVQRQSKFFKAMPESMSASHTERSLEITHLEGERTPTATHFNTGGLKTKFLSDDVECLIREKDEAFQTVGSALQDSISSAQGCHTSNNIRPSHFCDLRIQTCNNLSGGISVGATPPARSQILKKSRRKKKRISDIMGTGRDKTKGNPEAIGRLAEMALKDVSNNLSSMFGGNMFRIHADELPNRRLPRREIDDVQRESTEASTSVATEGLTPTDPFHLEELSSRIQAAQKDLTLPPQPNYPPPPPLSITHSSISPKPQTRQFKNQESNAKGDGNSLKKSETEMVIGSHKFLSPPSMHPKNGSLFKASGLSTISESSRLRLLTEQPDGFINLQSTPFTWTSPLFCHGPIKIERLSKEYGKLSPQEETLDWTAFQMAILGTMDADGGDQRDDWEWEADERELDEIMAWWKGFGFEGFGSLQRPPSGSIRLHDEDIKKNGQRKISGLATKARNSKYSTQTKDVISALSHEQGLSSVSCTGRSRVSLVESLPPSPMLDFVACNSLRDEDMQIPMGFNLGHDLGDFLSWEIKYVQTLVE